MSQSKPEFPIAIRFEDGSVETFDDVESLETGLEMYDSRSADGCEAGDALGRVVDLLIDERLELKRFELVQLTPNHPQISPIPPKKKYQISEI